MEGPGGECRALGNSHINLEEASLESNTAKAHYKHYPEMTYQKTLSGLGKTAQRAGPLAAQDPVPSPRSHFNAGCANTGL